MKRYYVYGLHVASEIEIPLLEQSKNRENEVRIVKGEINMPSTARKHDDIISESKYRTFLYWDSVGDFLVENGNTIIVDPNPGTDPYLLSLPLLGPVMAALLSQRGLLVLHGSAVANNKEAVVFLGPSGSGKSTAAAAMYAQGYQLVTDDVLVVDLRRDSQPIVAPGLPLLKLRPDIADTLLGNKVNNIFPNINKYKKIIHFDNERASQEWKNIKMVNILNTSNSYSVSEIEEKESFFKTSDSIYSTKFTEYEDIRRENFRRCLATSKEASFYYIKRTRDISEIESLVNIISGKT